MQKFYFFLLVLILGMVSACNQIDKRQMEVWLTLADESTTFSRQESIPFTSWDNNFTGAVIEVDPSQTFQEIDGFGFTLTGGSARLINQMDAQARKELLNELFGTEGDAVGFSYLRVSIGASDLSDSVFTYNDLPAGATDVTMEHFSIATEEAHLIPVLREILSINPNIMILGSPWTPPVWMKTNNSSIGGSLKPEFYDAYALYFVKYVQAMADAGIPIDAITVQNEPLHPGNNPSLLMPATEQGAFIKQSLGPAFRENNINTKIIIYDHNADRIDYPMEILADAEAAQYIDGSAFHLYGGRIGDLSKVHEAFPDKRLYFTEQWVGYPQNFAGDFNWHVRELIIGATRNWCRNVLEWNLAADPEQKPHTPGGCTRCLGALTIDGNNVERNVAYYTTAHASKHVRPGSVRIASNEPDGLPNVAFRTPDGKTVVIVLNNTQEQKSFGIRMGDALVNAHLEAGAAATYVSN